ncbi:DA1-related protein 3 [Arabidopsis thaliana]|uniref:DA1-related protein 3 n=1 Tax=Arabidopsis thaliana TaxID=3702 RepID=F4K0P2_ARATH|nr:DA1-related protein 3 [Arabidopsis thaliana]AED98244.1 DA1-related protein 3 [Arabidopsis thaliana]|eukprot:NP_001190638.1 DA1-related protein 3 [Arabidopsis thaliana]
MSCCFSCFKHDPSKDPLNTALVISRYEEEDRMVRRKRQEEDEKIEIERVKEESLKLAKQAEEKRRLEESKEQGKRIQVDDDQLAKTTSKDKGQINHSKDVVEEDVNPPPSIDGKSEIGDGTSVNPRCLCCFHCHRPFVMHEILKKGKFHIDCYKEYYRNRNCYVCQQKIPVNAEGIRKFSEHPFWKEKYCPIHDEDGTAKCCSCERLEPRGTNYVMLGDFRWLCIECMGSAVMDTNEVQPLHFEIREFFEGLFLKVDKEFALLLVEKQALNKAEEEEKIDYHRAAVTRGLCMSEEQIVPSIIKGPRMGPDNQLITDIVTESQRVSGFEVTGILIIYGLPRHGESTSFIFFVILITGYKNLKLELEEGLCQALGLRWLESQTFASTDAAAAAAVASSSSFSSSTAPPAAITSKKSDDWSIFEKKLVEFCMNQIKEDDSPVYGLGFKQVYEMMVSNNYNIKDTLKDIVSASNATPDSTV